ncbi:DUF2157 domain-containing protein [Microlunatus speluncae]|uniref:DUF2157 domain-containing protein n=1 Tax=Microlunatus speluncae TaxID=2594267 RepID=UPI001266527F|nr:DUF2157 domain-containing protein [Microlunatus speluncae]
MNATPAGPDHDRELVDRLRRSVERGVITQEQADLILADQPADRPAIAEAEADREPRNGPPITDHSPATAQGPSAMGPARETSGPIETPDAAAVGRPSAEPTGRATAADPSVAETPDPAAVERPSAEPTGRAAAADPSVTETPDPAAVERPSAEPTGRAAAADPSVAETPAPAGAGAADGSAPDGPPMVRGSIVAEALGYVGGVLVLIGAVTIAVNYWAEIGVGGRLAVLFGAAAVLLIAGAAVPARRVQVARRLRSVCWLVSVILFGAGISVLAEEVLRLDQHTGVLSTGCAAVFAGALWWLHRTVPQQVITVLPLALTASTAASLLPTGYGHVPGLAVWGFGVAWLLLAEGGVIAARRAAAILGGGAAVIGSLFTIGAHWGAVLSIGSAVVLVAAGVGLRNLIMLALGAVGILLSVPMVVAQYFPDALVVSLALLGCGVLLVAGGIVMARRGRIRPSEPARVALTPLPAIGAAIGVAIATTIAVLLLGR